MFHPRASAGAQVSLCCFCSQESVGFSCPSLRVLVASVSGSCMRSRVGSRQRLDPFLCPILSQAGENLFLELVSLFRSVLTNEPDTQPLGWCSHLPFPVESWAHNSSERYPYDDPINCLGKQTRQKSCQQSEKRVGAAEQWGEGRLEQLILYLSA